MARWYRTNTILNVLFVYETEVIMFASKKQGHAIFINGERRGKDKLPLHYYYYYYYLY